jgi:hypothetical protein
MVDEHLVWVPLGKVQIDFILFLLWVERRQNGAPAKHGNCWLRGLLLVEIMMFWFCSRMR